jgi:hypothetical protein
MFNPAPLLCSVVILALSGCASVKMLPSDAAAADFGPTAEGKRGWSSYRETAHFPGVSRAQTYEAAKAGLASADFALVRAEPARGVVQGQRGMTAHDWNIVAGVYFRESGDGFAVVVLAEGSKDLGFSGDATGGAWTGRILQGMRAHLQR